MIDDSIRYRHEYKIELSFHDYILVKKRLDAVMQKDIHAGDSGEYKIRSLYFDTAENRAYHEKEDGLSRRSKFRIRIYDNRRDFIRLEKKVKVAGLGTKISANLTEEQTLKLISGELEWMKDSGDELLSELYCRMRYEQLIPKTIVDYTREAYIYRPGNVRVTLDRNIRSGNYSVDIFNGELPTNDVTDNIILMEVKYDNFLPDIIRDVVQVDNRIAGSFSKYSACRKYTIS